MKSQPSIGQKRWIVLFGLAICATLAMATASYGVDEVTVQLKWIHQAQFAGFYAAEAQGYYAEEGIDVTFLPGGLEIDIVASVVDGDAQFSVVGADSILVERSRGVPIRAIATTYRINPFVLVAFADSGISSPYDFIGRTVAITSGYDEAQFQAMLSNLGIDGSQINTIPYTYDDEPFLNGEIDVTVSFVAGSLLTLREKTGDRELTLISPDDYGVHFYSDTIVARDDFLASNADLVLRFLRATLKGHQFAIDNPEATVEATMQYAAVQDASVQAAMLAASLPLIHTGEDQIGCMRSEIWRGMYDILLEQAILSAPFSVDDAYTMQFLEAIYGQD